MGAIRTEIFSKDKCKDREYVTMQGVTIPSGTVFNIAPSEIVHHTPHYSVTLALGDDHAAELIVSEDAIKAHPNLFTKLKRSTDIAQ